MGNTIATSVPLPGVDAMSMVPPRPDTTEWHIGNPRPMARQSFFSVKNGIERAAHRVGAHAAALVAHGEIGLAVGVTDLDEDACRPRASRARRW